MTRLLPLSLLLLVIVAVGVVAGCGDRGYDVTERRVLVPIGQDTVAVVVHEAAAPGLTYVNLHDDENTAVEAALAALRRHGGRLLELQHTGERNVVFTLADTVYTFDPNRIFTSMGIDSTLARLGPHGPAAHTAVQRFAEAFLGLIEVEAADLVVTVHNNTEERYSILSYAPGGDYAADALFVHVDEDQDPDDFFFVTQQADYDAFRAGGFNVVMQDNSRATDDGSLSVYCGRAGVPYVNVEAQHGHYEAQVRMIDYLNERSRPSV